MKKYFDPELNYISFENENVLTASAGPTSVELVKRRMSDNNYDPSSNIYVTDIDELLF